MLTFNLKHVWYDKIFNNEKTHEYRVVKPYWTKRLCKALQVTPDDLKNYQAKEDIELFFIKGYDWDNCMKKKLVSITIRNGLETDLKINTDVYDIKFCP